MNLFRKIGESSKLLVRKPIIFAVYLPMALLGLVNFSLDTTQGGIFTAIYIAILLVVSSYTFSFAILEAQEYQHKRDAETKLILKAALKRFFPLLAAEIILLACISILSLLIDSFASIFTSNIGQALTIVFFLAFMTLIVKVSLFAPIAVLKGKIGFIDSWKLVNLRKFFEIAGFLIIYMAVTYLMSSLNLVITGLGDFISSLLISPFIMLALTLFYLEYSK